jgi:predicted nucleic acid-binding protein
MTLYAESSAVLAWLRGETKGRTIRSLLANADAIIASELTLIECDRVLIRSVVLNEITEKQAVRRRARLNAAAAHWHLLRIAPEIVDRARRRFPIEPIRTLDALHLSSAMLASSATDDFAVLTLDERIRKNAIEIGLSIRPK